MKDEKETIKEKERDEEKGPNETETTSNCGRASIDGRASLKGWSTKWPDDTRRALIVVIAIADGDDSLPKSGEGLRHQRWNASSVAAAVEPSGGLAGDPRLEDGP